MEQSWEGRVDLNGFWDREMSIRLFGAASDPQQHRNLILFST
jgi:hypothetical protein